MSEFMDMIVDMLPLHSNLQKRDNQLRVVLDRTIGEYMDNLNPPFDELFLDSATGAWLDVHGADYGVPRKLDESDDDYRNRIVMEVLEHLTPSYLDSVYGLTLYCYVSQFNPVENTLTSDNTYNGNQFMSFGDLDLQKLLYNKLVLDDVIYWIYDDGIDYIINTSNTDVLKDYNTVHYEKNISNFFEDNTSINEVKLNLFNANNGFRMFKDCTGLTTLKLNAPNLTNAMDMFGGCTNLTSANLTLPCVVDCEEMFADCTSLESVDLNLPKATDCQYMFAGCSDATDITLNLPNAVVCDGLVYNCEGVVNLNVNMPKGEFVDLDYLFVRESDVLKSVTFIVKESLKSDFISYFSDATAFPNVEYLSVNGEVIIE